MTVPQKNPATMDMGTTIATVLADSHPPINVSMTIAEVPPHSHTPATRTKRPLVAIVHLV
jgi:hypothetical protein